MISLDTVDFGEIYALLEQSFPPEERRSLEDQKALLLREEYRLLGNIDPRGKVTALMAVWEFSDFVFLEHFAVAPSCRNAGLGTQMLRELIDSYAPKAVCLEAELPTEELSIRRQSFYKRNGFSSRPQSYLQPSLGTGRAPVPLQIFSTAEEKALPFQQIRKELYTKVYAVKIP